MSDVLSTSRERSSCLHTVNLKPSVLKDTVELSVSFSFAFFFFFCLTVEMWKYVSKVFLKISKLIMQIKKVWAELLILMRISLLLAVPIVFQ